MEIMTAGISPAQRAVISKAPTLPLLGLRVSDFSIFEYLPLELAFPSFNITLPTWTVSTERLRPQERVELNLTVTYEQRRFSQGVVLSSSQNERLNAEVLTLQLLEGGGDCPTKIIAPAMDIKVSLPSGCPALMFFTTLVKDSLILKKGILIYLGHLLNLFSRTSSRSRSEFSEVKSFFFDDLIRQVQASVDCLDSYWQFLKSLPAVGEPAKEIAASSFEEICLELHKALPFEIFQIALESRLANEYISCIKQLERRAYINYNTLITLFLRDLQV